MVEVSQGQLPTTVLPPQAVAAQALEVKEMISMIEKRYNKTLADGFASTSDSTVLNMLTQSLTDTLASRFSLIDSIQRSLG